MGSMKSIVVAALLLLPVFAKADTVSMILIKGKCSNVLIEGKGSKNPCAGFLGNTVFDSDEVLFAFTITNNEEISMLKFYGDGNSQVSQGENAKIQPITTVEYVSPQRRNSYAAAGQCKFQNPYLGIPAAIECSAETEAGLMKAKFLSNGEEPIGE